MTLLGIDVGNSGCKVAAFDDDGEVQRLARRSYAFSSPALGQRELDGEHILGLVIDCLAEVCRDGFGSTVEALAVSSQGEAVIPLDAAGRALAPVRASFDSRSGAAVEQVCREIDGTRLEAVTGNPRHGMFSLYKIINLRTEEPELFDRIDRVACFGDWVAHRLGGDLVMDHSLASRTSMLDVRERRWSPWVLDSLGIDPALLPALAPCGTPIGTVSAEIAERTGLTPRTVVSTGGHDQICCSLGAGVAEAGQAMNSMGTTDAIVGLAPSFDRAAEIAADGLTLGVGALDGYAMQAYVMSAGSAISWFDRTINGGRLPLDELGSRAWNDGLPSGIHFLPHLTGSGTPYLDVCSTGLFAGLTTESTPELLFRSVLEGIALELRVNLGLLAAAGAKIDVLTAIGGSARSDTYLQIKADVFGMPVQRADVPEAGCLGAALLAGRATGRYPSLAERVGAVLRIDRVFEPDEERHAAYHHLAEEHGRLYSLSQSLRSRS